MEKIKEIYTNAGNLLKHTGANFKLMWDDFDINKFDLGVDFLVKNSIDPDPITIQYYNILDLARLSQNYYQIPIGINIDSVKSYLNGENKTDTLVQPYEDLNWWTPDCFNDIVTALSQKELFTSAGLIKSFKEFLKERPAGQDPKELDYDIDFQYMEESGALNALYVFEFFARANENWAKYHHNYRHNSWTLSCLYATSLLIPQKTKFTPVHLFWLLTSQTVVLTSNWYSTKKMQYRFPCTIVLLNQYSPTASRDFVCRLLKSHVGVSFNISGLQDKNESELREFLQPIIDIVLNANKSGRASSVNIVCSQYDPNAYLLPSIKNHSGVDAGFDVTFHDSDTITKDILVYKNLQFDSEFPDLNAEAAHYPYPPNGKEERLFYKDAPLVKKFNYLYQIPHQQLQWKTPEKEYPQFPFKIVGEAVYDQCLFLKAEKDGLVNHIASVTFGGHEAFWTSQAKDYIKTYPETESYHEKKSMKDSLALNSYSGNLCSEVFTNHNMFSAGVCALASVSYLPVTKFKEAYGGIAIDMEFSMKIVTEISYIIRSCVMHAYLTMPSTTDNTWFYGAVISQPCGINMHGDCLLQCLIDNCKFISIQSINNLRTQLRYRAMDVYHYQPQLIELGTAEIENYKNNEKLLIHSMMKTPRFSRLYEDGSLFTFTGTKSCVLPSGSSLERQYKPFVPGTMMHFNYTILHNGSGNEFHQKSTAVLLALWFEYRKNKNMISVVNLTFDQLLQSGKQISDWAIIEKIKDRFPLLEDEGMMGYLLELQNTQRCISDGISTFVPHSGVKEIGVEQIKKYYLAGRTRLRSIYYYPAPHVHTSSQRVNN